MTLYYFTEIPKIAQITHLHRSKDREKTKSKVAKSATHERFRLSSARFPWETSSLLNDNTRRLNDILMYSTLLAKLISLSCSSRSKIFEKNIQNGTRCSLLGAKVSQGFYGIWFPYSNRVKPTQAIYLWLRLCLSVLSKHVRNGDGRACLEQEVTVKWRRKIYLFGRESIAKNRRVN